MKEPTKPYVDCNEESWQCMLWFDNKMVFLSNRVAWSYLDHETPEQHAKRLAPLEA